MRKLVRRSHASPAQSRGFWHPKTEQWPLHQLLEAKSNARTHSKKQRDKLAAVVGKLGFITPIMVDEDGRIISGHLRKQVAEMLGYDKVPVIQIKHLRDAEKRAPALAENRIALDAGWDRETLAAELGELAVLLPELQIDLAMTGFDVAEADIIIADHTEPSNAAEDQIPEVRTAVTQPGDLWTLGDKHRVLCGDARDSASYRALMQGTQAEMAFTDPPFNVSVGSHARGRSRVKFAEFAMASGEMSAQQYQRFLERALEAIAAACKDGAIVYVCIDWRHVRALVEAGELVFSDFKNLIVWVKSNGGQGSFYRSQHELICVFKKGNAPHVNSFELGQHGRTRTNVWSYPGVNSFKAGRREELDAHPTVKPVRLVADAMLDCSRRGAVVLDPFLGSGTTLIAGETVGRRVYGMELDPRYVDVAVRRWQQFTGRDAILDGDGRTFTEIEAARPAPVAESDTPQPRRRRQKGAL